MRRKRLRLHGNPGVCTVCGGRPCRTFHYSLYGDVYKGTGKGVQD